MLRWGAFVTGVLTGMPVRSCHVTFQDADRISHTAEVTVAKLYEAVGLESLRDVRYGPRTQDSIATSHTPPWPASGWGCRGRRLFRSVVRGEGFAT
jgi:hypothetical protein